MANRSDEQSSGVGRRVRAAVGGVQDKTREVLEPAVDTARAKVGDLQATLADAVESGADAVRGRTGVPVRAASPQRRKVARAGEAVATRLEGTALWLRENDLTDFGAVVRQQLSSRPGRTALLALGVGFLLGRASRR